MLPAGAVLVAVVFCSAPLAPAQETAQSWVQKSAQYLQRGKGAEARQSASKALEIDPRSADAEMILGLVDTAESKLGEAERHFSRAVSFQPGNYHAHAYLGSTYLRLKQLPEARRSFLKVLQLNPGNPTANYNLGLVSLTAGKPADALLYFEAAHRASPSDTGALLGVLESQTVLGLKEDSQRTVRALASTAGPQDPVLVRAVALLGKNGEYALAIPLLERIFDANPESKDAAYNLGLAYYHAGRLDNASQTLSRLRSAGRPDALDLLGRVEENRGRIGDAIIVYREAALADPGNEDYQFDYCYALLLANELVQARGAFIEGTKRFPHSPRMELGLGVALYLAGQYETAVDAFLSAMTLSPQSPLPYYLLGKTYDAAEEAQPRIFEAIESYLRNEPKDAWAYLHHARMLHARQQDSASPDFRAARLDLEKALSLDPKLAEAYVELGVLLQAEDRFPQSIAPLESAVRLAPDVSSAQYRLGVAYERVGEKEKARRQFEIVQRLKSDVQERERQSFIRQLGATSRP